jgi:ankyrin repeat protein
MEYLAGKKVGETYFVKKRMVARTRYEKVRPAYPDMPEADASLEDSGAELAKLAGREKRQRAAANTRRRENPLSREQLHEAERQIPLFQAAAGHDVETLRRLLDAGENPNAVAVGRGFTPLYNACFGGGFAPEKSLVTVRLLLERGADPNQRFEFDSHIDGRLERNLTAMMVAPTEEVARVLLDAGAEVNVADGNGMTPLMRAAGSGRVGVVRVLLERGADAGAKLGDGRCAADFAQSKLEFFGENVAGCKPGAAEERIATYAEIVRLLSERSRRV